MWGSHVQPESRPSLLATQVERRRLSVAFNQTQVRLSWSGRASSGVQTDTERQQAIAYSNVFAADDEVFAPEEADSLCEGALEAFGSLLSGNTFDEACEGLTPQDTTLVNDMISDELVADNCMETFGWSLQTYVFNT